MALTVTNSPAASPPSPEPGRKTPVSTRARKAPASKPNPRPRDPLKLLGLAQPAYALLIAPALYIDCREPITRINPGLVGDRKQRTYRLRFSGEAVGRDKGKQELWRVPSDQLAGLASLSQGAVYKTRSCRLTLLDDTGVEVTVWVFGVPTDWLDLQPNDPVWLVGTIERFGATLGLQVQHRLPSHAVGTVWPRYKGKPGLVTGERVERCVRAAMNSAESVAACVAHVLEETGQDLALLHQHCLAPAGFDGLQQLLLSLHAPTTVAQGSAALQAARQLSALAIEHAAARRHTRPPSSSAPLSIDPGALDRLAATLAQQGRTLTADQRSVADRILARLSQEVPLSALLSGDVGTGKTLAFLIPAVAAHLAGAKVAIVAPVRLLADQIARELVDRFGPLLRAVQRVENSIDDASAILVGTQGLLNAAQRSGYLPNFLIFDEQQRLSTQQREACVASMTHTLEVSATPIPRTLAATIYSHIEQLQLKQCPVRKAITSHLVGIAQKQRVITAIRMALESGGRVAVIFPRVNPAQDGPAHECVVGGFESFHRAFPDDAVMIHGELPQNEIEINLGLFRDGRRRLAIASTILEIGIDVPDIAVMVVRDADCFGMSQLHQLRGRLARAGGRGDFYMVVDELEALTEDSRDRLNSVCTTTDGYAIAEQDLLLRGFGDLDGDAQSGATETLFRLIKLTAHDFVGQRIEKRQANAALVPASPPATSKGWTLPDFVKRARAPAPVPTDQAKGEPIAPVDSTPSTGAGKQQDFFT